MHGQFGFFVIDTLQPDTSSYVVLGIATAASLVLAYLVHALVEKPFSTRLRRAVAASLHQDRVDVEPARTLQNDPR